MRLVITDLDNTLYDWVTFFAKAFQAMTCELSILLGVNEDRLLDEFREVHRKYGNSEYPFAAFELPVVRSRFGDLSTGDLKRKLDPAFHAFNRMRRRYLKLYDSVEETLQALRNSGIVVVGHTEAIAVNAYYRLQFLNIAQFFRKLYVLEAQMMPHPDPQREMTLSPPHGLVETVPRNERKPNPRLLLDICKREGVDPSEAIYVGDSLIRDIGMAKAAGIRAVWAAYGTRYDRSLWDILVRVTHWTEEDVRREAELKKVYTEITPDDTIESFGEILRLVHRGDLVRSSA